MCALHHVFSYLTRSPGANFPRTALLAVIYFKEATVHSTRHQGMIASIRFVICFVLLCQASFLKAQAGAVYSSEEAARRLARIQAIAASSNGKIEIQVVSVPVTQTSPVFSVPPENVFAAPASGPGDSPASDLYARALQLFFDGKFKEALEYFQILATSTSDPTRKGDCYYYLGECYLRFQAFAPAMRSFHMVLTCAGSPKQDDALFRIAMDSWRAGKTQEARSLFCKLLNTAPDSEYAAVVKTWLAQMS